MVNALFHSLLFLRQLQQIIAIEIVVIDFREEDQPECFVVLLEGLAD